MSQNILDNIYVDTIDNFGEDFFSDFNCGDEGMNNVLKERLLSHHMNMELTTKIIVNGEDCEMVGYFSLKNSSVLLNS